MGYQIPPQEGDIQGDLRVVARYCINQYRGILTAKTRVQVKTPEYLILTCERCGDMSLQKKRPKAGPHPCQLPKYSQTKTKSTSAPHTRKCNGPVQIVEEVT